MRGGRKPPLLQSYTGGVKVTGTVISGTMRTLDVLVACMDFLEVHAPEDYQMITSTISDELDITYGELVDDEDNPLWSDGHMDYILYETVFDLMGKLAPKGHYFDAHPGNRSDFGFWETEEEEPEETPETQGGYYPEGYYPGVPGENVAKEQETLVLTDGWTFATPEAWRGDALVSGHQEGATTDDLIPATLRDVSVKVAFMLNQGESERRVLNFLAALCNAAGDTLLVANKDFMVR